MKRTTTPRRPTALLLALLALPLVGGAVTGCGSTRESEPLWVDGVVEDVPSDRVLWQVTLLAFDRLGYTRARNDRAAMVVESGWKNSLAPFSREGYRTRAEVRLEAEGPGRWSVRARVKKQINKSIVNPLDPTYADWEWAEDDTVAARILVHHIRSRFDPEFQMEETQDPIESRLKEIDRTES